MSEAISRELPHRQELPYRAILSEKNGKFYFYQPELNLIASGDTVSAAYENFRDVRLEFLHEIERAGLENELPTPRARRVRGAPLGERTVTREMGVFLVKAAIVLVVIALIGAAGMFATERAVSRVTARLDSGGIKSLTGGLQHASLVDFLNNAARHAEAMPAARKEQLRESVGILAREAKPIVEALEAPFATPDGKAAHPIHKP
ncbi:MAG TPA: hypothetical protein VNF99_17060 [Stellaceae bacterium]|nr:hypothetical protein [Stellaceae bacterium]